MRHCMQGHHALEPYHVIFAAFTMDLRATLITRLSLPVAGAAQSSATPARGGNLSASEFSPGPVTYLHTNKSYDEGQGRRHAKQADAA